MTYDWIPNKSFDVIEFGKTLADYQDKFRFTCHREYLNINSIRYRVDDEDVFVDIDQDTNLINSITSMDICNYRQKNIIGLSLAECLDILGPCEYEVDPTFYHKPDGGVEQCVDIDGLSLQLWLRDEKIVLASMSNYDVYE